MQVTSTRATLVGAGLLVVLWACDIPTDLPLVESRWVVPAEETRFGVDELLPDEVTVAPDSTTFLVDFAPSSFGTTLGGLCPDCVTANGLTVPKPEFADSIQSNVDLPSRVTRVEVVSGEAILEVENLFGFDPIQPGAGSTGSITLRVTDSVDGDLLAELVIDGADTAFPSGSTLVRNLVLAQTQVDGALIARVALDSPAGDPVTVDANAQLNVVATPSNIRIADAERRRQQRAGDVRCGSRSTR